MTDKKFDWNIWRRVLLLLVSLTLTATLIAKGWSIYTIILVPLIIYQVYEFIGYQKRAFEELGLFVESVRYRDFSRRFDEKHAPAELQTLRKGFNEINSAFKLISKERETQYQYLQKILELVDTGILSYDAETGEVVWMNEALKKLLQLPYLKTIYSLTKRDKEFCDEIIAVKPGERKIATAHIENNNLKILLSATSFITEGKTYRLIAFQNINEALDETESKAWQKLLSVMTHEIMNSIAPISSLANTLKNRLQAYSGEVNESSPFEDLEVGIETIRRRSEGLLKFAETYRNLNKITTLHLQEVYVRDLFANLHRLMLPTLAQKNIELDIILKNPEVCLQADVNLLEQVLINLLVNAIEAVKDIEEPLIVLSADLTINKKVILKIADNGTGIPEDVLDKIFIPFFSTKKSGSGIGLSLCKQIVMLHHGTIKVQSVKDKGTAFTMQFG